MKKYLFKRVKPSSAVVSVGNTTGRITAVGAGTAVVYVLDPATRNVATLTVQVS